MTDDRAVRLALEAGRLRLERDALRATVARVEAVRADMTTRVRYGISCDCYAELTAALDGA